MYDDEAVVDPPNLWQKLCERRYLAEASQHEAEIRFELIMKVREAIAGIAFNPTSPALTAVAEAAVDALADFYRAQ
jgi:hypothetical protein